MTDLHAAAPSPAERVLTSSALFPLIVAFQDGLPGLLKELKRDVKPYGDDDLAALAVRHGRGRLRALEMIDSFRQQPQCANRTDLSYVRAARVAVELRDALALRWLFDRADAAHRPTALADLWSRALEHFTAGDFGVLDLLTERIPQESIVAFRPECWRSVTEVALLLWIHAKFPGVSLPPDVFINAVGRGDESMVDVWLARRREPTPPRALSEALWHDQWAMFLKLVTDKSLTEDEDERREMATDAVRGEDLTMLKLLHDKPFATPPVEALELAAQNGLLEFVEELVYRHREGILTPRALQLAASNGHLDIVKLIYMCSEFEGVPEAFDGAATAGHLEVVRFLHSCKAFTATHEAMDGAAANGHVKVLEFLHEKRHEGCMAEALVRAVAGGHDSAVQWLIEKREEVRCARGLDGLLLAGRVSEWLAYRDEWSLYDNGDVDGKEHLGQLMFEAGEKGKITAVRFICDVLGGSELVFRAIEGATKIGSVGWLFALRSVCPSAVLRGSLSMALLLAFDALDDADHHQPSDQERLDAIKWLLLECGERTDEAYVTTMQQAATQAEESRDYRIRGVCGALVRWMETRGDDAAEMERLRLQYVTHTFRFAAFGGACDWVVEHGVAWALTHTRELHGHSEPYEDHHEEDDKWLLGRMTWPKRAIERGDMAVLYYCHEISTSGALQDHEVAAFRFDDRVLSAAIATGHIAMTQWCVSTCFDGKLDDPYLLASAIKYAQPQIADWLLANHPQCCTEHSADRFEVWDAFATPAIFDWLDRLDVAYPQLVRHRQPVYIAYSLADGGHIALLERWIQTHPEILAKIGDVLFYAAAGGSLETVQFVCELIARCLRGNAAPHASSEVDEYQVQRAMAIAADSNRLPIVQFLFATFPGIHWHYAVRDAALAGRVRVLRFLFVNGYDGWAQYQEIQERSKPTIVRRLAFLCRTRGARRL